MPTDRAVGRASFLYAPCAAAVSCPRYLVLPDGRQFLLVDSDYSLSPDGRYVGRYDVHGYHVRDLLGTRELPVTVDGAESSRFFGVAWSPSSSLLLVGAGIDAPSRYAVATADGSRPPIQVPSLATAGLDERPVGLLDSGYLITLSLDGSGAIRLRSPSSLALLRTIVDGDAGIRAHLRPGEYLGSTVLLYPCGCQLAIGVGRPVDPPLRMPPGGVSTGFVAVDLNDGHVTGRVDLPASTVWPGENSIWQLKAITPGGIVVAHWSPDATEIALCNDISGTEEVVTRLPADSLLTTRGTV